MFGNVTSEKDKLFEENKHLKKTMSNHGLSPASHNESLSPSAAPLSSASGGSNYGAGTNSAFTPPLTHQSTAPSVSSSSHPGFGGNQFLPAPQQGSVNAGTDLDQAGIDFVLTYDNPSSKAYLSPPPQ
jgi:hypothetical protein